jgi:RNA polymerase sigma-70 factor (ECF subfamily)
MGVYTKSMNTISEKTIIEAICDGDHDQYRFLVERYHRGLIQHLTNLVKNQQAAEDIAQDTFIRAFEKIRLYNDSYAFSTWLYKIADNISYRHLKKTKYTSDIADLEEVLPDNAGSLPDQTDRLFQQASVRQAVDKLPHHFQRVITMYYWEDLSYDEIADIMERPTGTVRTWLHRAKEDLRKELYGRI